MPKLFWTLGCVGAVFYAICLALLSIAVVHYIFKFW